MLGRCAPVERRGLGEPLGAGGRRLCTLGRRGERRCRSSHSASQRLVVFGVRPTTTCSISRTIRSRAARRELSLSERWTSQGSRSVTSTSPFEANTGSGTCWSLATAACAPAHVRFLLLSEAPRSRSDEEASLPSLVAWPTRRELVLSVPRRGRLQPRPGTISLWQIVAGDADGMASLGTLTGVPLRVSARVARASRLALRDGRRRGRPARTGPG
jgi:hypothetical protein